MAAEAIGAARARPVIALVAVVVVALGVLGLGRGLWTPDEPREAEISREMYLSPGIVPTLNGTPFLEKPPLYYWVVATAFRLTGGPSAPAARAVSAVAGLATLVIVALWGRRSVSWSVGLVAALMLATSLQFLTSTHWVLIDPLLMAVSTLAAWAAWEVISGRGGARQLAVFYLAMVLALWTKGLVGPVLLAAGLVVFMAVQRAESPWRRFHVGIGVAVMAAAAATLAAAIFLEGGREALWEWAWVNHVQRFLGPVITGHRQPFYYYLKALPVAVLPWLVPLLDACRPGRYRAPGSGRLLRRYCASLALGMFLVLTASSTKREIYLLPMLPPLFLLLAANVAEWWEGNAGARRSGVGWWVQFGLVAVVAAAPGVGTMLYTGTVSLGALASLVAVAGLLAVAGGTIARRRGVWAAAALLATAVVGAGSIAVLVPRALEPEKDMAPAAAWIGAQQAAGEPVYAVGADETLRGIIPFVTGRRVIPVERGVLVGPKADASRRPQVVLVQYDKRRPDEGNLGGPYVRERSWTFGVARSWGLWRLQQK